MSDVVTSLFCFKAFKKFEHFSIQDNERRVKDIEEKLKKKKMEEERLCVPSPSQEVEVEVDSLPEEQPNAAAVEAADQSAEKTEPAEAEQPANVDAASVPLEGATAAPDTKQEHVDTSKYVCAYWHSYTK